MARLITQEIYNTAQCESQLHTLAFLLELHTSPESGNQERKNEALLEACRRGNKFLAQSLLMSNAHVDCRDAVGNSPLTICAAHGFSDIAWLLIGRGADVNCVNFNGDSALSLAVGKPCSTDLVRLLLQQETINVYHKNREGYSTLMTAVVKLDFDKVQMILQKMFASRDETLYKKVVFEAHFLAEKLGVVKIFLYMEQEVSHRKPAFLSAMSHGDIDSVRFLLDYGIVKKDTDSFKSFLTKTLKFYHERGSDVSDVDLAIVEKLLEHGKSVFFRSKNEKEVLALAVQIGNLQLLDLICSFISKTDNVNPDVAESEFNFGLKACVKVCRCDLLAVLLRYRPDLVDVNMNKLSVEQTLIAGRVDFLSMLWCCGITFNAKDSMMISIIHSQIESLNFVMEKLRHEAELIVKDSASGVFHKAIEVGDVQVINRLMRAGADVNGIFERKTPLMYCSSCRVAEVLFQYGANINQRDDAGHVNAMFNLFSVEYAAHVLKQTNILTKGFVYLNEISEECVRRYKQLVKDLLDLFLRNGGIIEDKGAEGKTVLMFVSQVEEFGDLLSYLLQGGADSENQDTGGKTALYLAVSENRVSNVDILLTHKANVNAKCQLGMSCLHQSVKDNNREMIKLLASRGADVNAEDVAGNTSLALASSLRGTESETLKCLLDSGAELNHRNHAGYTPLMMAASLSYTDLIPTLCEMGADVNARNYDSTETALAILVERCDLRPAYLRRDLADATHYLLERGASAECVRVKHIMGLIFKREYKLLQRLIYAGASPSELDIEEVDFFSEFLRSSHITTLSPFRLALFTDNAVLANYFIKINFLTDCDVFQRAWAHPIRRGLINFHCLDALTVLDDFYSKPMSLETMSLITISSAVGAGAGRESRVMSLPLPAKFKNELIFHTYLTLGTEVAEDDSSGDDYGDDDYDDYFDFFDDSSMVEDYLL